MSDDPDLTQAVARALRYHQTQIRTLQPGTVVSYNPATNVAQVQPDRPVATQDGAAQELAPVVSGPVQWLRVGGFVIWTDLLPGDKVAILCSDRDIGAWRKTPPGAPLQARGARMHSMSDAVILPGLWPDVAPIKGGRLPGQFYIGNEVGTAKATFDPAQVVIEGPLIRLGSASVSFAIKGTDLAAAISTFTTTTSTLAGTLGAAAGVWGAAAGTWAGLPAGAPVFAVACTTFGTAVTAFCTGLATACGTLAASVNAAVSAKVQVQ